MTGSSSYGSQVRTDLDWVMILWVTEVWKVADRHGWVELGRGGSGMVWQGRCACFQAEVSIGIKASTPSPQNGVLALAVKHVSVSQTHSRAGVSCLWLADRRPDIGNLPHLHTNKKGTQPQWKAVGQWGRGRGSSRANMRIILLFRSCHGAGTCVPQEVGLRPCG